MESSFLKTGDSSAFFRQVGNRHCWKDMLTNVVMGGANASFPDFNNFGGNESQPEDLRSLRALNSLWTSFVDTGDN